MGPKKWGPGNTFIFSARGSIILEFHFCFSLIFILYCSRVSFTLLFFFTLFHSVTEESENVGLKLNIQKTKIMVFCTITSWQIDEGTVETLRYFILGDSKITSDVD